MSYGRDDHGVPGSPFNDPPPRGASRLPAQPSFPPQQQPHHDHIAFQSGAPNIYSPPPVSNTPSYPPQTLASVSTYSLTDSYAADSDEKGYRPVEEPDEESTPLRGNFGAIPHGRGYDQASYPGPGSAGGSYNPGGFAIPSSHSGSFSSQGPQRGLTRKQTNAEAFRQRQQKLLGRSKTKKVVLKNGHLITEFPVPTAIRNANRAAQIGNNDHPEEFTHLRYTAATCDPDDFTKDQGWSLRAVNYGRETELLIAITYYNEDKVLLARTLHYCMTNIADIVKARWSEFRSMAEKSRGEGGVASGADAWKRLVVTLIFDGLDPADKEALDMLATLGIYQDAIMQKSVDGAETVAHIFEYTTALSMTPKLALVQPQASDPNSLVPVQMIFILKQKNAKKINSHRWLFNALGKQLKPNVCILLDGGTKPGPRSLYYLWEAFYHNKHLGGACGEIHAMLKGGKKLFNPLVAAQNFEYKISNILDKPTESSFGYVSVLPGAFSAYRYRAIQGRPLEQYFHGDISLAARLGDKGVQGMTIFQKNMFLAEDRILCFELVAKANERWVLGYVKPSLGETDVPEQAAELIGQRRRWLNGSFAAGVYSLVHFFRLYKSNHGVIRMFFLHIQALFNTVTLIMSWFQLGNWFLTFYIIINLVGDSLRNPNDDCWSGTVFDVDHGGWFSDHDFLGDLNWVLGVIYLATLGLQIILALGNRPKGERLTYTLCFIIFGTCALWLFLNTIYLTVKAFCPISSMLDQASEDGKSSFTVFISGTFGPIFAGLAGTFGVYILASFLYLDPWHIFHSFPQYLVIVVSFTNILNVYAFANLHDVSWGTKGSDQADALPAVQSKKTKEDTAVAEIAEVRQEDVDSNFQQTVKRAMRPLDLNEPEEKPTMDDQNKTFRTRLLSVWILSNSILALVVTRLGNNARNKYFQAILWITFGLSFVRFMGFCYYMFGEVIFRAVRLCARPSRK